MVICILVILFIQIHFMNLCSHRPNDAPGMIQITQITAQTCCIMIADHLRHLAGRKPAFLYEFVHKGCSRYDLWQFDAPVLILMQKKGGVMLSSTSRHLAPVPAMAAAAAFAWLRTSST